MTQDQTLVGRYTLGARLGSGGGGEVFEAVDHETGESVALKRLWPGQEKRDRREIAAMRLLRVPGVVRLLDAFQVDGSQWLVMAHVQGRPFPGCDLPVDPRARWAAIRHTTEALFGIVSSIHHAGLVHRDLKPENVLVSAAGQPMILDFGLVRGTVLGSRATATGELLGTPVYLAPEQMFGANVDARADLYSLGVMVYEALAGKPPFGEAWLSKLGTAAPPLADSCPSLPREICDAVDAMLCRLPEQRPDTVEVASVRLMGEGSWQLPWLGGRRRIDDVVVRLCQGHAVRLSAAAGHGLSRFLHEVAEALEAAGHTVLQARPASGPFQSLPFAGDQSPETIHAEVVALLAGGAVVAVPDPSALDSWSQTLLESLDAGAVLWASGLENSADVQLCPLSVEDLAPLFWGPNTFLHLQDDASALLFEHTGGVPAAVARRVQAWVRDGDAHWDEGRLRMTRVCLDRLRASVRIEAASQIDADLSPGLAELYQWTAFAAPHGSVELLSTMLGRPSWMVLLELAELHRLGVVTETAGHWTATSQVSRLPQWQIHRRVHAHRKLALSLPRGASGRLDHLIAAGLAEQVVAEVHLCCQRLREAGRTGAALALARQALVAIRHSPEPPGEAALLDLLLDLSLASDSIEQAQRTRTQVHGGGRSHPVRQRLATALEQFSRGEWAAVSTTLAGWADEHSGHQALVWEMRVRAARVGPIEALDAVVLAACDWALSEGDRSAQLRSWQAYLDFAHLRFERAAQGFDKAAALTAFPRDQLRLTLAGARSRMAMGDFAGALSTSGRARNLASRIRDPRLEARAVLMQRSCQVRGDVSELPQPELVDAISQVGEPLLTGSLASVESWAAYRLGQTKLATILAYRAIEELESVGSVWGALHAQAMVAACGCDGSEVAELTRRLAACPLPDVAMDALALLGDAGLLSEHGHTDLLQRIGMCSASGQTVRVGVFSPAEAGVIAQNA